MTLDNRHTIALPYWARPGVALFAKKATDDDESTVGDDDEEEEEPDDDDDADDDLADLTDDELRAELKKARQSLSTASGSNKVKRDRIKRLNRELEEARKPKPKKADDDEAPDAEAIKAAAKAEARAESDARIRTVAARSELKAAGIPAEQVGKLIGMLDLDSLDVDDEGEVDGLDEAIEELKAEWPQLFTKARKRRDSISGDRDERGPRKTLTPSQQQAAAATGKRAS